MTVPGHIDLEKMVLGAVLVNARENWPVVANLLTAADFQLAAHQLIFARCEALSASDEPIDRITIYKALDSRGEVDQVGGLSALIALDDGLPQLYNLDAYCQQIREAALLRMAILALTAGVERLCSPGAALDTLQSVQSLVAALDNDSKSRAAGFTHIAEIVEAGGFLQPAVEDVGIPWPWPSVTDAIGGLMPGEVVIISAATGVGKTTAASQAALVAAQLDHPVAILSLEMSQRQVAMKITAQECGATWSDWIQGRSSDEDRQRIVRAANRVRKLPMWFDDTSTVTPAALDARIAALNPTPRVVLVDYLQLMQSGLVDRGANREQHVAHISRSLRLIAKKYGCTIVALSQINAAGGARESSAIENDASAVVRLDRREFGAIDWQVLKSRFSARTKIPLHFDGRTGIFSEG